MDKTQEDWETEYAPDKRIFEILAERDRLRKGLANALPELQFLVGHLEGRMGDAAHTQFLMLVDDLAALLREEKDDEK